jgi:hypothetical protein
LYHPNQNLGRRREKGFNQIRVFNLGFEAGPLSVATGGPELGFPGTLPSTDRSHSLEFRVIKNVPYKCSLIWIVFSLSEIRISSL